MCFNGGFPWKALWKHSLLNEVEREKVAFTRARNERVHNDVHKAEIQNVQFTFTKNMNVFVDDRSLNAFGYNTARHLADTLNPERLTLTHFSLMLKF